MTRRLTDEEARPVMLAAGLEPQVPYPGERLPWPSKCTICKKIVSPSYGNIRKGQGACKFCTGQVIDVDIAFNIMLTHNLRPLVKYPGSNKRPWPSECLLCGGTTSRSYSYIRRNNNNGCGICAQEQSIISRRIIPNDAVSLMLNSGLKPLEDYPGFKTSWRCECLICGNTSMVWFSYIKYNKRSPCLYCVEKRVAAEDAVAFMLRSGLEPVTSYPGQGQAWPCYCISCKSYVSPRFSAVKNGHGCRVCARRGSIAMNSSMALVYLMCHTEYNAIKIGVGLENGTRIKQHEKHTWSLLQRWTNVTGVTAMAAESRVLCNWRKAGIPVACTKEQMPQGGWTETAPLDMVDIAKVRRWVNYEIRRSRERGE